MSGPLLDFMTREQAAIGAFIEVLEREASAMIDGNFAQLPELAQCKSELADQIKLLEQQREREQLALGYATGRGGADAACAAGDEALRQGWQVLLERAAQAHNLNHRNGVMVHAHLDFTRQTLSFLQAGGQPLYGPDGTHATAAGGGTSLAQG